MRLILRQKAIALIFVLTALTGCGTISPLKTVGNATPNLSAYDKVVIENFSDGVHDNEKSSEVLDAGKFFADSIAMEIQKQNGFRTVMRTDQYSRPDESALLLSGEITRYQEGKGIVRLLLPVAGSSYLDAVVKIKDGGTNSELGMITVDRNSWPLGGIIAATQTVDTHMLVAALKIAKEIEKAKETGGALQEAKQTARLH